MIDFDKITQRELEDYFKAFQEYGGGNASNNVVQEAGASARAAVKMKWSEMVVNDASPKDVVALHLEILKGINKATLPVPKN